MVFIVNIYVYLIVHGKGYIRDYGSMAKRLSPNSPVLTDCVKAFFSGGAICAFAEGLNIAFSYTDMSTEESKALTTTILIAITAILTALGVFDKIAKHAGAGTAVPITGFANGVAAPAIEYKKEGQVFGIGCKIFTIAGPVILYGIFTSWVLGLIYWIGLWGEWW